MMAAEFLIPHGVHVGVIPTLTMLAIRHFKHDAPGEHEPKHPAVKFVVAAWNEGDFNDAEKHVATEVAISVNGLTYDPIDEGGGLAMARKSIEHWRTIVPDLKMSLLHEIHEKDQIAFEWLITGTHTGEQPELAASGNAIELQGSAFLSLADDKIIAVSTDFDALALTVQTGAGEVPAWWARRS